MIGARVGLRPPPRLVLAARSRPIRMLFDGMLLAVIAIAVVLAIRTYGLDWTRPDGDPWNYLAAGERLNAGHPLYDLGRGDRPVILAPPYWTVPLLAPPPIAVAWRPLAALGEISMLIWGWASLIALLGAVAFIVRRGGLWVIALLAYPLALTALSANASALVLALLVAAWRWRSLTAVVAPAVAIAGAIKLTPLALLVWLVASGRWRTAGWTVGVLIAIGLVSLVGAGPEAFVGWLGSATAAHPSPRSLAVLLSVSPVIVPFLLSIPIILARWHDRLGFGLAIVAAAIATPALYFPGFALLAAVPVWRDRAKAGTDAPAP